MTQEELIKMLREREGSRQKLANALGVSVSTAQAWEKSGVSPDGRSIARMCRRYRDLRDTILEVLAGDEPGDNPGHKDSTAALSP